MSPSATCRVGPTHAPGLPGKGSRGVPWGQRASGKEAVGVAPWRAAPLQTCAGGEREHLSSSVVLTPSSRAPAPHPHAQHRHVVTAWRATVHSDPSAPRAACGPGAEELAGLRARRPAFPPTVPRPSVPPASRGSGSACPALGRTPRLPRQLAPGWFCPRGSPPPFQRPQPAS